MVAEERPQCRAQPFPVAVAGRVQAHHDLARADMPAGAPLPPVAELPAAIILGGAMGVHDSDRHPFLTEVKGFVRECATSAVPLLGICLGGQLLAELLGGRVHRLRNGEHGCCRVRLTAAGVGDPPAEVAREWKP